MTTNNTPPPPAESAADRDYPGGDYHHGECAVCQYSFNGPKDALVCRLCRKSPPPADPGEPFDPYTARHAHETFSQYLAEFIHHVQSGDLDMVATERAFVRAGLWTGAPPDESVEAMIERISANCAEDPDYIRMILREAGMKVDGEPPAEAAEGLVDALIVRRRLMQEERERHVKHDDAWKEWEHGAQVMSSVIELAAPYEARRIAAENALNDERDRAEQLALDLQEAEARENDCRETASHWARERHKERDRAEAAERRVRDLEQAMNRWIADARQSMPGLGLAATQHHPPMMAGLRRIENALDCMARVYAEGLSTAPAGDERVGDQGAGEQVTP